MSGGKFVTKITDNIVVRNKSWVLKKRFWFVDLVLAIIIVTGRFLTLNPFSDKLGSCVNKYELFLQKNMVKYNSWFNEPYFPVNQCIIFWNTWQRFHLYYKSHAWILDKIAQNVHWYCLGFHNIMKLKILIICQVLAQYRKLPTIFGKGYGNIEHLFPFQLFTLQIWFNKSN